MFLNYLPIITNGIRTTLTVSSCTDGLEFRSKELSVLFPTSILVEFLLVKTKLLLFVWSMIHLYRCVHFFKIREKKVKQQLLQLFYRCVQCVIIYHRVHSTRHLVAGVVDRQVSYLLVKSHWELNSSQCH